MITHLITKELRQHSRILLVFLVSALLLPCIIVLVDKWDGLPRTLAVRLSLDMTIALVISYFSPSFVGFTLMASERTKRTLLVLRMLPVSSVVVIAGKELAGIIAVLCLASANILSFWISARVVFGVYPPMPSPFWAANGVLGLIVLLQISLWMFLSFDQKWATQVPFLAAGLIRPAILIVQHAAPPLGRHGWQIVAVSGFVCEVVAIIVLHFSMLRSFDAQDWAMPTPE